MTDFPGEGPALTAGTAGTQRTGSASADTVPAGALLLINNAGAGSHNFDLGVNFNVNGMLAGSVSSGPGKRRIVIAAASWTWVRVNPAAGDANSRCSVTIDATASEVKYFVSAD